MKKIFIVLALVLFSVSAMCQKIDNTGGRVPALVKMPITNSTYVQQDRCNVNLSNTGDWYQLEVTKNRETVIFDMTLLSKAYEEDGSLFYQFDRGAMHIVPVYDTIGTTPTYDYSLFKITVYADNSSIYEKITFLFDNIR